MSRAARRSSASHSEFALGDGNQLFRRIGDERVREIGPHPLRPDRIAHDRLVLTRLVVDDALAQEFLVVAERLVGPLVRLGHPPREHRVVARIVAVPALERAL
jgi:hypothetical protein